MARKFEERTAKPTNDAYTGMLALSFVALLIGCTFLYMQVEKYSSTAPSAPHRKKEDAPAGVKEEPVKKETTDKGDPENPPTTDKGDTSKGDTSKGDTPKMPPDGDKDKDKDKDKN